MPYTEHITEGLELVDVFYGANVAANTESNSGYVDLGNYNRILIVIHPVSLGDALDVDIEQASAVAGTGAKTLDAGSKDVAIPTTDTLPTAIEIQPAEFDVDGGFDCLNVEVTTANTGGGANYFVVEVWARPRFLPASEAMFDDVVD